MLIGTGYVRLVSGASPSQMASFRLAAIHFSLGQRRGRVSKRRPAVGSSLTFV